MFWLRLSAALNFGRTGCFYQGAGMRKANHHKNEPLRAAGMFLVALVLALISFFITEIDSAAIGKKSGICGSWNNYCRGGRRIYVPPPPPTPAQRANPYFQKAWNAAKAGRLREAEQAYLQVIRINPNDSSAHNNLAIIYGKWKNYSKALAYYRKAIKLNPNNKHARDNLKRLL